MQEKEYSFKESILRLHEMLGDTSISFEYDELPGKIVTVDIEDKQDD